MVNRRSVNELLTTEAEAAAIATAKRQAALARSLLTAQNALREANDAVGTVRAMLLGRGIIPPAINSYHETISAMLREITALAHKNPAT